MMLFSSLLLFLACQAHGQGLVINPRSKDNTGSSNAVPIDLTGLRNSKAFAQEAGEGDFDNGKSGYPAEYVPPSAISLNGIKFDFPQYNASGYDNVIALGQSLDIPKGRYFSVHLLAAAQHTSIAAGFINSTYADGSTLSDPVIVSPWWDWPYPFGGDLVFPYHLNENGTDYNKSMIYHVSNRLDSTKDLSTLQLPNVTAGSSSSPGGAAQAAQLHVFAISLVPADATGLQLDVQYARTTQTWIEGTNKTQIVEATINNIGDTWVLANSSVQVSVSSAGLKTVVPAKIKRLRPGDQAIVYIGVENQDNVASGSSGSATLHVSGNGVDLEHTFNATYGIAEYEPTFESIYSHEASPWYQDAKYGIFIHWGVYAVPGWGNVAPNENYGKSEWYWRDYTTDKPGSKEGFYDYHLKTYGAHVEYDDFIQNFTAARWDPKEWVDLFADAGANYFVQVSKHHDGYSLFDQPLNVSKRTSVQLSPHRDLLKELFEAAEQYQPDMHRATYYSLPEWMNPAYKQYGFDAWPGGNATNPYTNQTVPYTGFVEVDDYVPDIILPQMQALANLGTEIMWCDIGGPNLTAEFAASYFNDAAKEGRQVLINSRCGLPGDFDTPEYARYAALPARKWESNLGLDPFSYGYNRATPDDAYLRPLSIVQSLVDIVSKNGNFLLDVGPTADGTIVEIEQKNLRAAGKWINTHREAIFGTRNWWITQQEGEAIRFTHTIDAFYITSLYPPNGTLVLQSPVPYIDGDEITVVGGAMNGTVAPSHLAENGSLVIQVSDDLKNADQYAWTFKIAYDAASGSASGSVPAPSTGGAARLQVGALVVAAAVAVLIL